MNFRKFNVTIYGHKDNDRISARAVQQILFDQFGESLVDVEERNPITGELVSIYGGE